MSSRTFLAVALSGALVLAACSEDKSSVDETTRDESGEVTDGGELGVQVLQVGDCIVAPQAVSAEGGEVDAVKAVPCEEPHDAQVFATMTLSQDVEADDHPGSAALEETIVRQCLTQWEAAIGTVYEEDLDHDLSWVEPTEFTWEENDDRGLTCMVIDIDGGKLTGDLVN